MNVPCASMRGHFKRVAARGAGRGSIRARLALRLWNAKWGGGDVQRDCFSQSADSEIRLGDFEPTVQDPERTLL